MAEVNTNVNSYLFRTICNTCKKENFECQCHKLNTSSSNHIPFEKQLVSQSKFTCSKCKELYYVEDLDKHSSECKSLGNSKMGKCKYCLKNVLNPETEHINVTKLKPPECDVYQAKCPNCMLNDVIIKKHFNSCPNKPKICDLSKIECDGFILSDSRECTSFQKHNELINLFLKRISSKIAYFINEDPYFSLKIQELEKIEDEIYRLKESMDKLKTMSKIQNNGKLIWKIENAEDFLNDQQPKMSLPVYTSDYGYKIGLKVYPNGDGAGKRNHLSLYFVILKGEFDDLLSWPFKFKVKITLFNKDTKNKSKYEIYKPDETLPFQQPTSNVNKATGNPKFIELETVKNAGFIIDNSLFIELSVEHKKTYL